MFLTKCSSSDLIPLNLHLNISGCTPASFLFERSISLVRDHYDIFQYYCFYYNLYTILICYYLRKMLSSLKQSLWYSLKLMKLPGRDRCRIPSEHTTYILCLMYSKFRLCVHVKVKRTSIFHKCSECWKVRTSFFKNHEVVQDSCVSSAFYSSKVISKLYFTDSYERWRTPLQSTF